MICRGGRRTIFCLAMAAAIGCEKSPPPPTITEKPPAEAAASDIPTTQQLLNGQYKRVSLAPLPFTASVPDSWETRTPEGTTITVLHGPGIDGADIQMTLEVGQVPREMGGTLTSEKLDHVLAGAKRDADRDKANVWLFNVKSIGDTKVMEEQRLFGIAGAASQQQIDWKITYFIHRDIDFAPYEINVLGLTPQRFEQSKELVRKIIDSVQPEHGKP